MNAAGETLARLRVAALCVALAALGLWLDYRYIIIDFGQIPGNLGDARLVNLFLEHNYITLFTPRPGSLWDPTWLFYPTPGGFAMSEVLTGSVWLYAPLRWAGLDALTAFQVWLLVCSALNFAAQFLLLRQLRCDAVPSAAAAFVYAFGMARVAFNSHPQLIPTFYGPLALLCLWRLFTATSAPRRWALAAAVLTALQFWTSFYLAVFFCVAVALGVLVVGRRADGRRLIVAAVRPRLAAIGGGLAVYVALCAPLALRYLHTASLHGTRSWGAIMQYLPEPQSLYLPHPDSLLYHDLFQRLVGGIREYSEKFEFSGFLTLLAPIFLLLAVRRWRTDAPLARLAKLVGWTAIWLSVLPLKLPLSNSLWALPYYLFPGVKGVRAVGRIVHVLLIVQTAAFALLMTMLARQSRGGRWLALLLSVLVTVENWGDYTYAFTKKEHADRVGALEAKLRAAGPVCATFYAVGSGTWYAVQVDAMWASLETGIPTVNGYSGFEPPGYGELGLSDPGAATPEKLDAWRKQTGIERQAFCFIRY